ncbi:MAG: PAS domain-containing sensor histidine kinase, partial [Chitinophagaceae bacterium]
RLGRFLEVSNAAAQIWGFCPEELLGRPFMELVCDEDRIRTEVAIRQVMEGRPLVNFENRFVHKNGHLVPLSWSAHWDPQQEYLFGIARDLSDTGAREELQRKYEQLLQAERNRLLNILDRIKDGFFVMDENWIITYGNRYVEDMLGISKEDYLGRNYWESFPEAKGTPYDEQYHKAMAENVPVHFEAYFPPFERWFSVDAYPSRDGLSIFFRDVTEKRIVEEERRAYEAQIEQQNKLLTSIFEGMNQAFFLLDEDMRVIYWNRLASELFGWRRDEVLGLKLREWLHGPTADAYEPLVRQVLRENRHLRRESICPFSGRWEEVDLFPSEGGVSVFIRDVNDRKRTEEELRKLSLVAENTVNIVIISDPNSKVLWANRAAVEASGYSFDELIGMPIGEVVDGPDTAPEAIALVEERRAANLPYELEAINYRRDGTPFWVHVSSQPLFDEEGRLQYYFSIATDITERKRLEQTVQRQQQRTNAAVIAAQEKERAQVGRELHDNVNQVLTSVKLYQELLLSGIGEQDTLVRKSIDLLQASINEIRSLSKRLSAPTLGNIRLRDSVKELAETVAATEQFAITVDTKAVDELEVNESVHLALYRILQEQLTNILKYAGATQVLITFRLDGEQLSMTVADNGGGTDMQQKSAGIGLSNMKARAESLGGTACVDSAPGKGFRLTVSVPLHAQGDFG